MREDAGWEKKETEKNCRSAEWKAADRGQRTRPRPGPRDLHSCPLESENASFSIPSYMNSDPCYVRNVYRGIPL